MDSQKYYFCPRCYTTLVLTYDEHITCPFCGISFKELTNSVSEKTRLEELELISDN